jgi:hypothetical protein
LFIMANTLPRAFIRLGFSPQAAEMLADPLKENLDIEAMRYLDDKDIKTLCLTLQKPGGTTDGPAPAGRGRPAQIPNTGVYVSTKAEKNLKAACYMAKHYWRTARVLDPGSLVMDRIQRYAQYKEAEKDYKEPDDAMKLAKPEKILDFIDEWPEHLAKYDGSDARPLSYVIREVVIVPAAATDPPFGEVGSSYVSLRDEIAARAEHDAPQYRVDNARVYDLLNAAITEHKNVKTWIKPYAPTRDGRGAWIAFKQHYRGSSEVEAIEEAAENRLDSLKYRGEKPRYNFETHVSNHVKSHLELEKATGQALSGSTKVRRLLKSMNLSPTMAVPIASVRANDVL